MSLYSGSRYFLDCLSKHCLCRMQTFRHRIVTGLTTSAGKEGTFMQNMSRRCAFVPHYLCQAIGPFGGLGLYRRVLLREYIILYDLPDNTADGGCWTGFQQCAAEDEASGGLYIPRYIPPEPFSGLACYLSMIHQLCHHVWSLRYQALFNRVFWFDHGYLYHGTTDLLKRRGALICVCSRRIGFYSRWSCVGHGRSFQGGLM